MQIGATIDGHSKKQTFGNRKTRGVHRELN